MSQVLMMSKQTRKPIDLFVTSIFRFIKLILMIFLISVESCLAICEKSKVDFGNKLANFNMYRTVDGSTEPQIGLRQSTTYGLVCICSSGRFFNCIWTQSTVDAFREVDVMQYRRQCHADGHLCGRNNTSCGRVLPVLCISRGIVF